MIFHEISFEIPQTNFTMKFLYNPRPEWDPKVKVGAEGGLGFCNELHDADQAHDATAALAQSKAGSLFFGIK